MSKRVAKIKRVNKSLGDEGFEKFKNLLAKKNACYVLITCSKPTLEGQMDVELNFEGDIDLASLIVDNASQVFHEKRAQQESL